MTHHLNSHNFNSNNFNNKTSLQNIISTDVSSIYSKAINFMSNFSNKQTEQKSHISISTENINQIDSFFNNLQPNKNEQSNYLQCMNFIKEYS